MTSISMHDGRVVLHQADCRDVLRGMPDNSIDSVVTDPPYALVSIQKRFGKPGSSPAKDVYGRGAAGFMGKTWDTGEVAFSDEFWAEVLRVLKPGGHVVAFSGTRTYHRMAVAIEDAGFECRDMLSWVYGSGFPKSHDVSKGIDRVGGMPPSEQAELLRSRREAAGLSRDDLAAQVGCTPASVRDWEEGRARVAGGAVEHITPSKAYRAALADLLGYSADERRLVGVATDRRDDGTVYGVGHGGNLTSGGHTDAAAEWQGWGTALKPAHEPICLARKPLIGTVAENVLQHGTGALNIDGCRVNSGAVEKHVRTSTTTDANAMSGRSTGSTGSGEYLSGRWPANICHDGSEEVLAAFPTTGPSKSGKRNPNGKKDTNAFGDYGAQPDAIGGHDDNGGSAARFFYCAKASRADRDAGLDHHKIITIEGKEEWGSEGLKVQLRVDTGQSAIKVIGVSGAQNNNAGEWNTLLSGKESEDLYRLVLMSTTRTETKSTMSLKISNCSESSNTNENTPDVRSGTGSGGSRAGSAESGITYPITISERMASALGVSHAASQTLLQISAKDGRSSHPTVKPVSLCQWLCRLVTPPGGVILDPFMGSGSTGKAAVLEGFRFVGCEREDEYMPIATARIAWAIGAVSNEERPAKAAVAQQQPAANDNDLFSAVAA